MKKITILFGLLIISSLVIAGETANLTAKGLYKEFTDNEIAAENKYKGKKVNISGKISSIKKNIANQPVINLDAGPLSYISCRFDKNYEDKLIGLKKGQTVGLNCKVEYKMVTSIFLCDCNIIE